MTGTTTRRGAVLAVSVAVIAAATACVAPIAAAAPATTPHAAPHAAAATRWDPHHADFNGDGRPDLVTGVPAATVDGQKGAGQVAVAYGATGGIATTHHQLIAEGDLGIAGPPTEGDAFGRTTVPVDINDDGYTDLVVGAPGTASSSAVDVGSLTILWGSPDGLTGSTPVDLGRPVNRAGYGNYLVAGDFDGDGKPDLVTSSLGGGLTVLHGIGTDGKPASTSDAPGADGGDSITRGIAAGDVNGDGITDLVVTAQDDDDYGDALDLGGSSGFTEKGVIGRGEKYGLPGEIASIGDVNGDGYGDVVMGRGATYYDQDADIPSKGGVVMVAYGGPAGISTTAKSTWVNQDTAGVPGVAEDGDAMGSTVTVADVDGDGYADVVAGVPGEDFDGITDAGSFLLLKGTAKGLTGTGATVYSQSTAGIPGTAEKGDRFGGKAYILAAVPGQGAQIVIGDPDENAGTGGDWVLRSSGGRPTTTGTITFGTGTLGITPAGARFGDILPATSDTP